MTRLKNYAKWAAMLATAVAISFMLAACTNTSTESSDDAAKKQEEDILTINKIDGDSYSFKAVNETDLSAKTFQIKSSSEEAWSDNLLVDATWKAEEKAKIAFAKSSSSSTQESPEGEQIVVKPTYDIQIVLEDDTTYVIHSLPIETLDGASEGHLKIDSASNLAYFEFDDVDGFTSSLDNDKQIQEAELAAEEAKRAEEEAAAAAEAEAQASQSYTYSDTSTSGGTSRNTGGSSQSQNDCTGGFVTK